VLDPATMLPAVGQGALGIECREDDDAVRALLAATDHRDTRICVSAERGVMTAVGGSCQLPVAAYAEKHGGEMWLRGMYAEADGTAARHGERRAPWPTTDDEAFELGSALGRELRS
jgi:hydroxymethylbilane synthase